LEVYQRIRSWGQVPEAHSCNPSYSGDRDQEDRALKPNLEQIFPKTLFQNTQPKKGLTERLKCRHEALSSKTGVGRGRRRRRRRRMKRSPREDKVCTCIRAPVEITGQLLPNTAIL
jgi:hypothetical protein